MQSSNDKKEPSVKISPALLKMAQKMKEADKKTLKSDNESRVLDAVKEIFNAFKENRKASFEYQSILEFGFLFSFSNQSCLTQNFTFFDSLTMTLARTKKWTEVFENVSEEVDKNLANFESFTKINHPNSVLSVYFEKWSPFFSAISQIELLLVILVCFFSCFFVNFLNSFVEIMSKTR